MTEKMRIIKRILGPLHTRNIPHTTERCSILVESNIQQKMKSNILTQTALLRSRTIKNLSTSRTKQGYVDTHFDSLSLFWDHVKQSTHNLNNL